MSIKHENTSWIFNTFFSVHCSIILNISEIHLFRTLHIMEWLHGFQICNFITSHKKSHKVHRITVKTPVFSHWKKKIMHSKIIGFSNTTIEIAFLKESELILLPKLVKCLRVFPLTITLYWLTRCIAHDYKWRKTKYSTHILIRVTFLWAHLL